MRVAKLKANRRVQRVQACAKKGTVLLSTSLAWPLWLAAARQKLSLNLAPFLLLNPVHVLLCSTELGKQVCPRLRELAPGPEAGSRNLGQPFLAISVFVCIYARLMILSLRFICPKLSFSGADIRR